MIKQIKSFQAVVRCKSFTEAAEACFLSQSAISQQIQALEHELGVKLLNRENRRFSLTPAGEYFYQKSLVLIADYERMCQETARIANQDMQSFALAISDAMEGRNFGLPLRSFQKNIPMCLYRS